MRNFGNRVIFSNQIDKRIKHLLWIKKTNSSVPNYAMIETIFWDFSGASEYDECVFELI